VAGIARMAGLAVTAGRGGCGIRRRQRDVVTAGSCDGGGRWVVMGSTGFSFFIFLFN